MSAVLEPPRTKAPVKDRIEELQQTVSASRLGLWQSCKGLAVELQYKKFDQGGQYTQSCVLPEKLVYGKVRLERAINQADSTKVQNWLRSYVANWQYYTVVAGRAILTTNVTVNLLDFQLNQVMSWTLYNARPSKWEGPALNGVDNKIAIEALDFEHEGFLYKAMDTP